MVVGIRLSYGVVFKVIGEARMPHSNQKVAVCLDDRTWGELEALVRSGSVPARQVRNARVLLMADEDRRDGRRPDWYIAECVGISERQVCRIRQKFVREGIDATIERKQRSDAGIPKTLDGPAQAQLVALCCSDPPAGHQRWTLQLLVDELGRLEVVASVCRETVRQCLKKTGSSLGERNGSAFRKETGHDSSPTWSEPSTSTAKPMTLSTR